MSGPTEEQLTSINVGKSAHFALQHVGPLIEKLSSGVLAELKIHTRSGAFDSAKAQGLVQRLLAYDDLISTLRGQMNAAESTANELGES